PDVGAVYFHSQSDLRRLNEDVISQVVFMDTRISMQSIYQNALTDNRRIALQLASLQAQAATGQKYAKVSDNPSAALTILNSTDQNQRVTAHLANIQSATTALNTGVSALQQVSNIFGQAKS